MPTLGLLTIGQAPRPDGLARDVAAASGMGKVLERGALDGLSREDLAAMRPGEADYRLVTLLSDGNSVEIAKRFILARLQAQIEVLEAEGADAVLLMCTGEFPPFQHRVPLVLPQLALYGVVKGLAGNGTVASLTPLASQVAQARAKWSSLGIASAVFDADPYGDDPCGVVASAAARAREAGAAALFMDCFGYDAAMGAAARAAFGGPVVVARSMAARIAAEVAA
ncbi:MAG: AroM family protein [bacterium]|nr:AroM family protein [bacterium]